MTLQQDILEEYQQESKHSRFYTPIIILLSLFLCFLLLNSFMDIENLSFSHFDTDWINILLSVLIPGCGLIFFIAKTRIGWFISMVFMSFIACAGVGTVIHSAIINESNSIISLLNGRRLFILIVSITVSILLQTKSIRSNYKISNLIWIVAIALALLTAVALIFLA